MGQSIIGVYYLLERKIDKKLHIFRLPFLLSLTLLAYIALSQSREIIEVIVLLGVLWALSLVIYLYQNKGMVAKLAKKIIECCKNW
jgi:hypothetical protein